MNRFQVRLEQMFTCYGVVYETNKELAVSIPSWNMNNSWQKEEPDMVSELRFNDEIVDKLLQASGQASNQTLNDVVDIISSFPNLRVIDLGETMEPNMAKFIELLQTCKNAVTDEPLVSDSVEFYFNEKKAA
jgi:hypothetical protein